MNTTTNLAVAETIKAQIGNAAIAMLGATLFVGDQSSLMFKVQGCRRGNKIRVVLAADDTYTVELWKIGRAVTSWKKIEEREMVYADALRSTIASLTGLAVSL